MGALNDMKAERLRQVVEALTKPMSADEVADALRFSRATVKAYLPELRDAGRVHIAGTRRDVKRYTNLWIAGPGKDETRRISESAVKRGATEEEIFSRPPTVVRIHRDPLVAALFGEVV